MNNLDALFAPRSIAVLGASTQPDKMGSAMARQLSSFPGTVSRINARAADPAHGLHASVQDAANASGAAPDLVVACLPAPITCAALAEAAAAGCRAAVVCSGGFAEVGGPGVELQASLAELASRTGMRILGPNTSGFVAPGRSLIASFVRGAQSILPGTVGLVAASGGVNHAIAFALSQAGIGVEVSVGVGNAVDVDAADIIDHLAQSPTLTCIALHLETVQDGPALIAAISRAARQVPVVVLVVGRADVGDFARSHTGALATSWRTTRSALRAAGAVLVEDERQLVDAVCALALIRLPASSEGRVGLVTGQAGPGLLIADGLRSRDVVLPPLSDKSVERLAELLPPMTYQLNPVDTGRPSGSFGDVLTTVGSDPAVDLLTVYGLLEPDAIDLAECVADVAGGPTPVLAVIGGPGDELRAARAVLQAAGVPTLDSPASAVRAIRALLDDATAQSALRALDGALDDVSSEGPAHEAAPIVLSTQPTEYELKQILSRAGVAVPESAACADPDSAHAALARIGAPVVVKMLEPVLDHKSDTGAVQLNISTSAEMDQALAALGSIGAISFLVEEMVPGSLEILVGAHRDPVFGPVVVLGLGGVTAEVMADVAVRLMPAGAGPVREQVVEEMIDELALAPLLRGFRGLPAVNAAALGRIIDVVVAMLAAAPDSTSFEINPVTVTPAGTLVALDASLGKTR